MSTLDRQALLAALHCLQCRVAKVSGAVEYLAELLDVPVETETPRSTSSYPQASFEQLEGDSRWKWYSEEQEQTPFVDR
jgi:hypothetical protein